MKKNKKQTGVFQLFLCCIGLVCILSGCSNRLPDADDVKNDLNNTAFIDASELYELYDGATKTIPVTEVTINDSVKIDKNCILTCTVIQENENYRKETQLEVSYSKFDNWVFNTYSTINTSVMPVSGVPDEVLKYYSPSGAVELSDITHNFDTNTLTDTVSWNCVVERSNCIKTMAMEREFRFEKYFGFEDNAKWDSKTAYYQNKQVINREWKFNELEGTVWQGDVGTGHRTLRINSIDTVNHTMDISYGWSDLKNNEICRYETKDFQRGEPEQELTMSLTYDFYDVEIFEDSIWFGATLTKTGE